MNASNSNTENLALVSWAWISQSDMVDANPSSAHSLQRPPQPAFDLLLPLRDWLDNMQVQSPQLAHRICQLVPAQCPFERDVKLFGRTLFHIPPMCKLNPLYEQVVALRFRALCFLADDCGEDISQYC